MNPRQRRSPREPTYDYATPGAYFVTICTHEREPLFGEIVDGEMRPNDLGAIVADEWAATGHLRPNVRLDAFVVMPNHVHAVVWIEPAREPPPTGGAGTQRAASLQPAEGRVAPGSLGAIVRAFKGAVTRRARETLDAPDLRVWQGRYHDRIVRDDDELERI